MNEKIYLIKDDTTGEVFAYKNKSKAMIKLIELCEQLDCSDNFKDRADFQRAVRLGYFDDFYMIEEIEVES